MRRLPAYIRCKPCQPENVGLAVFPERLSLCGLLVGTSVATELLEQPAHLQQLLIPVLAASDRKLLLVRVQS